MSMDIMANLYEIDINMDMNIEDMVLFDLNGKITATDTDTQVRTRPDSSSTVIDLSELFGAGADMIGTIPESPAPAEAPNDEAAADDEMLPEADADVTGLIVM